MTGLAAHGFSGNPLTCPVLVGREEALGTLRRLVDEVGRGASTPADPATGAGGAATHPCRVALVAGDAGIGKSRLVREAAGYARERGWLVLVGASFPHDRASPYAPLLDLLRAHFAGRDPSQVARAVGPFAREIGALLPDVVPPGPGPPAAADGERQRLFAGLAHCLLAEAARQPVLVVVEDLHWCDDASLDFLLHLARRATGHPLLLLATYRDEDAHPRLREWLVQVGRARLGRDVALRPLGREDVAAMVGALLGRDGPPPRALVEAIDALAEGNPFCIEELLAAGDGAGRAGDGAGRDRSIGTAPDRRPDPAPAAPAPGAGWRVPAGVQGAVQERILRVSPAAREVTRLAAVFGRRFDFELLQAVAQVDEATLVRLIRELVEAGLVVEEAPDRFAFRHALTREVAYGELLARERRALHRLVADAIERADPAGRRADSAHAEADDAGDGLAGDLAHHYFEAEVWDKALHHARRAARHARRVYAPRAAAEHLTRAVAAAERLLALPRGPAPDPAMLFDLRRRRGQAFETLGDLPAARADFDAARALAIEAGDRRAEWDATIDLGGLWTSLDYARAGPCYERALGLARELGDPILVAHSLNRVGNWRVNAADPRDALPLHREALAIVEAAGDPAGTAATLDLLGMAAYVCADLAGAVACYARAIPLLEALDDRQGLVTALLMHACRAGSYELGTMDADAETVAAGIRDGERALALAREIGWRAGESFAASQLAGIVGLAGQYARALELAARGLTIAEEIGHRQWTAGAHAALGQVYLDMLALPPARRHLERALEDGRAIGSRVWIDLAAANLACTLALAGAPDEAADLLGPAPEGAGPARSLGARWRTFAHGVVALARGDGARALGLLGRVAAPTVDERPGADTPRPAILRARALLLLGHHAEAHAALGPVLAAMRRQGTRTLVWRAEAALGDALRALGRADEAARAYAVARATLEDLAAGLPAGPLRDDFLRATTAALPRAYRLSTRRVVAARHGGLTAREREVAALVARGMSNKEIADALVLGERTVETHVGHVLNKLGLGSRREVARWVAEHGLDAE